MSQSDGPSSRRIPEPVPERLTPAEQVVYLDARIQGLCHDGALELVHRRPIPTGQD